MRSGKYMVGQDLVALAMSALQALNRITELRDLKRRVRSETIGKDSSVR